MKTEAHQAQAQRVHRTLCRLNRARRADLIVETPIVVNGVHVRRKVKAVWGVWEKSQAWPPQEFHRTRGAAEIEAANLAALNPGKKFQVAQLETKFSARRVAGASTKSAEYGASTKSCECCVAEVSP